MAERYEYPSYLDYEASILRSEEDSDFKSMIAQRIKKLKTDPDAIVAWRSLRVVSKERFQRVGQELARHCLENWPESGKELHGLRPAKSAAAVTRSVKNLVRVLQLSPALKEITAFDVLSDETVKLLQGNRPGEMELREQLVASTDEPVSNVLQRFHTEVLARLHGRHGDSYNPIETLAFDLVALIELKRNLGKPSFECPAALTRVVFDASTFTADRLRKAWRRAN